MAKMRPRLWKPTKIVLWTGAGVALFLAIYSGKLAIEYDRQGVYTGNYAIATFELMLFNAVVLFLPFLAVAGSIEFVRWLVRVARSYDRAD